MSTLPIETPEELLSAFSQGPGRGDVPRWVLEAAVVEAVRVGAMSRGRGGDLLGLSFQEREDLYAARGVFYDDSPEERAAEAAAVEATVRRLAREDREVREARERLGRAG